MTTLNEKGLDPIALTQAYQAYTLHKADPGRKGDGLAKAITAYLNALASTAPADDQRRVVTDETERDLLGLAAIFEVIASGQQTMNPELAASVSKRMAGAADALASLRARVESVERERDEARGFAAHWHREIEVIATILGRGVPDAGEMPVAVRDLQARAEASEAKLERVTAALREMLVVIELTDEEGLSGHAEPIARARLALNEAGEKK